VIHLLYSANRWEAKDEIERLLTAGTTLIVDRYSFSGVAFSSAKGSDQMDFDWCCNPEIGLPEPDVVIFLDMSIEESKKRGDFGLERYEKEAFQKKVKTMYSQLMEKAETPKWVVVDAARTIEEVHVDMKKIVEQTIEGIKEGDQIKKLWV
jgi:dTMP kinase